MKKYIIISLILLFITGICYRYIDSEKSDEHHYQRNTKQVIFVDKEYNLVPVSIPMDESDSKMNVIYNKLEIMKSDVFVDKGLYPVFNSSFEVISLNIEDNNIIMHLYIDDYDKVDMIIIESLSYILNDVFDLYNLSIVFHNDNSLDSSVIHMTHNISRNLGINNFIDTSLFIHNSISVEIYKDKIINGVNYLVPITYRIDEDKSINEKIAFITNVIDKSIILKDVDVKNNIVTIDLDNNILNDNEKISLQLETKLVLSLMSLSSYDNIDICIDGESVRNFTGTNIVINYSHLL